MNKKDKSIRKESVRGGVRAVLGFVLTTARLIDARPFGVSYAASSYDLIVWRYGGVFLGYLLTGSKDGILYAALTAILFSCALVFKETKVGGRRWFMPACVFIGVIFVKSAALFKDFSAAKLALILFEGVFSSAAAVLFASARNKEEGTARDLSVGLMAVAALSLLSPVKKYIGIDPAALAACTYVLRAGSLFGGAAGAGAGVFLGAVLDLRAGYVPKYCLVYAVGGLLCGVFASAKKGTRFAVWVLGCVLPALWTARGLDFVLIMTECLITGGAYYLFVEQKTANEKDGYLKRPSGTAFEGAADALLKLGENVTAKSLRAPFDPDGAIQRAADAVCRACPRLRVCWSDEYLTTAGVFSEIARAASNNGGFSKDSVPSFFLKNCLRADELCDGIEKRLETCRRRRELFEAKTEGEELMKKQFKGVSDLIRELSLNTGRALCRDSDGIGRVIKAYYPHSRWDAYFDGHRFIIDVYPGAECAEGDGFAAAGSLSLAVGCRIEPPERVQTYGGSVFRFVRREKYAAEGAASVRPKDGEKVSGDSVRRIYTDDGRAVVVLSDGMGTGEAAHEMSGAATDMIADLVSAGASLKSAVFAVLPVLEARFERSGFVTLDALELDLFCGGAVFIKCGAPPSVIIRGDKEEKISARSLPAGLREEPAVIYSKIRAGDTVIMATDGVSVNGGLRGTPFEICGELTKGAAEDDAAAVVLRLKEA